MKINKKAILLCGSIVLLCLIMAWIDGILMANYFVKSVIKLILFLGFPFLYAMADKDFSVKSLFRFDKKSLLLAISLGLLVFGVIFGGYFAFKNIFDFSNITTALTKNIGVTGKNFIYVSLYISFVNSLLEEFFFRGVAYISLKNHIGEKTAFIFSAGVFAIYHVAMMIGWFSFGLFALIMAGLFAGGVIFNMLDRKSSTLYPSWITHMFANFAINSVGFILFGVI